MAEVEVEKYRDIKGAPALKEKMDFISIIMGGVVMVLFLGFITLLVTVAGLVLDAWRFKSESYMDIVSKSIEQNQKIETLTNEIQELNKKFIILDGKTIVNPSLDVKP